MDRILFRRACRLQLGLGRRRYDPYRPDPTGPSFVTTPNPIAFPSLGRDIDPNGGLGGFQLGYNYQVGSVVYGVEGDITWTGQRDTFNFNGIASNINFEDFLYQETTAAKLRYMGTVRGRLGYAYGAFLPYLTGGLAWGRMVMDLSWTASQKPANCPACTIFATRSFARSESHTLVGWTIGGGFEYAFADRWSAKAEYLFVDLGNKTYFSGVPAGCFLGLHDHIVRLGINYRLFSWNFSVTGEASATAVRFCHAVPERRSVG